MRLFTAIDLPDAVLAKISDLLAALRPNARIQWSPLENMHVTTKFIGEWPEQRVDVLTQALGGLGPRPKIVVHVRRVGFFPNPHSARVFWCGIEAPGLEALAVATDQATAALGIASENRPFSPHLTLARIKERIDLQPLREAVAARPSLDFGMFEADRFYLYQSKLSRSGSRYTKLAEFPF